MHFQKPANVVFCIRSDAAVAAAVEDALMAFAVFETARYDVSDAVLVDDWM